LGAGAVSSDFQARAAAADPTCSAAVSVEHPSAGERRGLRIASAGHALFALTLIGIGIRGLAAIPHFAVIWTSVPRPVPLRAALASLTALLSLGCGAGLLFKRSAAAASRVLLGSLASWLLLVKGYYIVTSPLVEGSYQSAGETAVLAAAAGVLYAWFASGGELAPPPSSAGARDVRLARGLYALALIAFGLSHFAYLDLTAPLVPAWLPGHVFWAYFTGSAYLAAAAAVLSGVLARLAAALSAAQMGLFTVLVWMPLAVTGRLSSGQWTEFGLSWALTAAAWVVADSFRGSPWLALRPASALIGPGS
jgi:uncharacterized membrane protein